MTKTSFKDVSIDTVKEYWNQRPCNIRHSPAAFGTKEYFEQVEQRKYFVEPHIPGFADFPDWKGKKVLEIGCGIGTDTMNFAKAGAQVTAIDLSSESLDIAKKRAEVYGLQDVIHFHQGNAENLSSFLPFEIYDLVYSFGVIHHTPNPECVVEEIKKFVSPESELRIMVYSKVSYKLFWIMHEEGIWDMGKMDTLVAKNSEAQTGCPVTYTYTFDEIRELLNGFDVVSLHKTHIFTWDISAYNKYQYIKDPAWTNVNDEQLRKLEKELGWHTLVKAKIKTHV
ncbi:MAG: class I SAM-dependent methyltransferase [SAR324 cluster bacterium]|nr:class I SAM-dependent methyltransferase [SAR324 cluster bacterium]